MNRLQTTVLVCLLGLFLALSARAETFQLNDGSTVTGEVISMDEGGLRLRLPEGTYSEPIPWTRFSQADLRKMLANQKAAALVAPFIEIPQAERIERQGVGEVKRPERLPRPTTGSVFGSLFGSALGWLLLLAMYGANIYAGLEVAIFRAQPRGLVCGVSAALPVIGPIIFLCLPTRFEKTAPAVEQPVEDLPVVNPMKAELPAGQHSSLHVQHDPVPGQAAAPGEAVASFPPPEVFSRGQFTFNRRFIETRFSTFFGVHHGADKDKVLVVKSLRKEYVSDRIVRVTQAEVVLQIKHGVASEEAVVPFNEIQEIVLKHRDAP